MSLTGYRYPTPRGIPKRQQSDLESFLEGPIMPYGGS